MATAKLKNKDGKSTLSRSPKDKTTRLETAYIASGDTVATYPGNPLIDISLPFPPSINTMYATVNGRRVLSKEGRQYKLNVAAILQKEYGQGGPLLPLKTPFAIEIQWFKPSLFNYDWDGAVKALQDAIFQACNPAGCTNDAWVISATVNKMQTPYLKSAAVRIWQTK